ncbi:MAG: DsbA family protein [Cytophagales bacterium]
MYSIFRHLFVLLVVVCSNFLNAQSKLIYIADPLCSWCYGFQPELDKVLEHYKGKLSVEFLVGGLGLENKKGLNREFKDGLLAHWKEVHAESKQPFDSKILNTRGLIYNSLPLCLAVQATKSIDSTAALAMHKKLQQYFFAQNKNVTQFAEIQKLAGDMSLDTAQFRTVYYLPETKTSLESEFKRVEKNGIDSFPVLILVTQKETVILSEGYTSHKNIIKKINKLLK